jgi:hypothetical protein
LTNSNIYVIINTERNERGKEKMKRYKVEHKYCKTIMTIKGNDFYHACKLAGLIPHYWNLIEEIF